MNLTRRDVLRAGGGAFGLGFAGCLGAAGDASSDVGTDGAPRVQASFFVVYDLARRIGGDAATVESVVPFGQHAHGWEPSPSVVRAVLTSNAFVYAGRGFQPWADDLVATIESDAPEVTVVDARRGIDLVDASGGDNHDDLEDHDDAEHHDEKEHDGEEHDHHDHDHDEVHDHGNADPHFWLDPRRTKQAVENVRDAFAEMNPDAADAYRDGAGAYLTDLDALDATFETALTDAEQDAVLVAGHDAFGYLGHRYGFEVYALTGLAPDAEPSARAIREAQAIIDAHGIEHVLAPALESQKAAEQLVAETDATAVLPITSLAGLTDEWQANGWGYLEVMERVNLPSLETALGAG